MQQEQQWEHMDIVPDLTFDSLVVPYMATEDLQLERNADDVISSIGDEDLTMFIRELGLLTNQNRAKFWPKLAGCTTIKRPSPSSVHPDEDQAKLDIKRTSLAPKGELEDLVITFLRSHEYLHYYQGFHDIASVILLVLPDPDESYSMLEKFSLYHLRDYMTSDVNLSLQHLRLIPAILEVVDHQLFKLVKELNNAFVMTEGAYYDYNFHQALSSILTVFSHDVPNLDHLLKIWDFCLSYDTILINIYIYVATLVYNKPAILRQLGVDPNTTDFAAVDRDALHNLLSSSNLFKDLLDKDLSTILSQASYLFENYPLNKLSNSSNTFDVWFRQFNCHSVYLTTSPVEDVELTNIDNKSWADIIRLQDSEMNQLAEFNISLERLYYDDDDDTEYESGFSLSSSLSSLQSSTLSLNSKILKASSTYFKKMLFPESEKKSNNFFKLTTIYKISLTVGFVGFLLHFLLSKNKLDTRWLFNNIGLGSLRNSLYNFVRS